MHLCFSVTRFPEPSQTFVLAQVLYAVRAGHRVTVACTEFDADAPLSDEAQATLAQVRIVRWPPPPPALADLLPTGLKDRIIARRARDLWRREIAVDAVIAHFGYRGAAIARAQRGWPGRAPLLTVFHGRDVSVEYARNQMAKYRDLFRDGDLFLPVNAQFADQLVQCGAPGAQVRTHYLGIPVAAYPFAPKAPQRPLRLVTICRLVEKKGIDVAIRALALLSRRAPQLDWRYDIGGDGPLAAPLQAAVAEAGLSGRVRFLGPLPHSETLRRISEADAMLVPSVTARDGDQEGIPVTLMEAMALGTPVCTTRHSGIPELVTHGETGLLADSHDAAALCDNVLAVAQRPDPVSALAHAARRKVERAFNEETQNAALLTMCQSLSKERDRQSWPRERRTS